MFENYGAVLVFRSFGNAYFFHDSWQWAAGVFLIAVFGNGWIATRNKGVGFEAVIERDHLDFFECLGLGCEGSLLKGASIAWGGECPEGP